MTAQSPPGDAARSSVAPAEDALRREELSTALAASTSMMSAILDSAIDAIMTIDAGGTVTDFSRSAELMFGWSRAEAVGRPLAELVVPDELRDAHTAGVERVRLGGEPHILDTFLELPAQRRDGTRFPAEVFITRIQYDGGSGYVGFVRDVSERLEAQETLQRNERRFRTINESSPDLLITTDERGRITFVSESVQRLLGYTPEHMVGRMADFLLAPAMQDGAMASFTRLLDRPGFELSVNIPLRRADGVFRTFEVTAHDHRDDDAVGGLIVAARDVTERDETERDLRSANSRLVSLIENLAAAVLVEDDARRVVLVNQEYCDLFELPADPATLIGTDCSDAPEQARPFMADPDGFVRGVQEALRDREVRLGDDVAFADGRRFERDFVPIEVDGEHLGHLWLYRDVTARRRSAQELALARDEALRAARAKADFLASMSHEIRTPMHGILATAELLRNEPGLGEDSHKLAGIMLDSARALSRILDDVLDFSKIDAGETSADLVPFDLAEVIRGVVDLLVPAGRAKGVDVHAELDPEMPTRLLGAAGWLRQIVLNIAGNAVKFTDAGTVVVDVGVRPGDDPRSVTAVVEVRDTGCGIYEEELPRLFAPFVQADSSSSRRHGGTGLGLAITKQLCEAMGGTVEVTSTPGVGSVFTVALPFTLAAAPQEPVAPSRPLLPGLGDMRVLVVEDNEFNREIVLRQLAVLGADAMAVPGGAEAVAAVAESRWDCVLMDCHMPGMDGFQTTRAIRALAGAGRRTPIVALTASALESDREACLEAGMDDHLAKPLTLDGLRGALERWVAPDGAAPRPDPQAAPPADAPAPPTAVPAAMREAQSRLRSDLGDGEDGADGLVEIFLGELDGRLAAMHEALADGDAEVLCRVAHTLKSIAATLGADALTDRCKELERVARDGGPERAALLDQLTSEAAGARAALCVAWEVDPAAGTP